MKKSDRNITVSELFVDIYKKFNVIDQTVEMYKLSQKELYLLLILALDKFDEKDSIVVSNFGPFHDECKIIFDLQSGKEIDDKIIQELCQETGDKYIETDFIVDKNGKELPSPLTKEEVRDLKLEIIQKII